MIRLSFMTLFMLVFASSVMGFSRLDLDLSNEDLEVGFDLDVGQLVENYAKNSYFVGLHFLSTDDSLGYNMFSMDLLMESTMANSEDVRIALGLKVVATVVSGQNFLSFPLGGRIEYMIPKTNRVFVGTFALFFAPAPLSIDPAESYFESRLGVGIEPTQMMRGYIEWRILFTNFVNTTVPTLFNHTVAFGARIGF